MKQFLLGLSVFILFAAFNWKTASLDFNQINDFQAIKCDTSNVTYSETISSIIQKKCKACHQNRNPGGGIDLTTYKGVKAISNEQRLLKVVMHEPGYKAMPKGRKKLSDCEIEAIRAWLNKGASNN